MNGGVEPLTNPNFSPLFSTNEVYRNLDKGQCLTDNLDTIEADLGTFKASIQELFQRPVVNPNDFAPASHIHPVNNDMLWSGALFMTNADIVMPSKKLSDCDHGWMLLWSDADVQSDGTIKANNFNFVWTPVYKLSHTGSEWSGSNHIFIVPTYMKDDASVKSFSIKQVSVSDEKLVGHVTNNLYSEGKDAVLRAVYEF